MRPGGRVCGRLVGRQGPGTCKAGAGGGGGRRAQLSYDRLAGAGKTLMARSLPSILPKLSLDEALDITRIYSVTGQLPTDTPLVNQRPFRSPHHTISNAGLVGGGRLPRPGEISLAHRGVLFLDELPEFGPKNLETLRQPLEDKVVTISRAQGCLSFPANFMLVGAMNPCPCGWFGDTEHECTCKMSTSVATRSGFPALCWTGSISTSRCRGWIREAERLGAASRPR